MPHRLVRAKAHDRKRSLGWLAVSWMEYFTVHGRGGARGKRVRHGDEMTAFIADAYALSPKGRMLYDSGFFSRPKGADKSGLGARFGLFEALGPCRFAGFAKGGEVYEDPWGLGFSYTYEKGEPMGKPIEAPFVRVLATEEGQAGNVYDSIYFNLTDDTAPLSRIPGIDCGLTRTIIPGGGEIRPSTASSASKDGGLETFVVFDETHLYVLPELRGMYDTVTRNLRKRKAEGTWYIETTTMYEKTADEARRSTAERTYLLAEAIDEGRSRRQRLLADHRWGECEDLTDEISLRAAVEDAFGDAMVFNDLESIIDEFYDPRKEPADSRRFFLNAASEAGNAWFAEHEIAAAIDASKKLEKLEPVCLGFDGSRKRSRGVTDATGLIASRVRDGHLMEIHIWEQPQGEENWEVPVVEIDAEVHNAFATMNVVGFYGDPAGWETYFASWEAKYGSKLKVKASRDHPMSRWMTGGKASETVKAIERFHESVVNKEISLDGRPGLIRHLRNAVRRGSRYGIQIAKPTPESPLKIDGAVAALLANECRLEALAKGLDKPVGGTVRRIR